MLQALFGEVKGLFGKTYLLTGILPAALVAFVLEWYFRGLTGLQDSIQQLFSSGEKLAAGAVVLFASILILGLLFSSGSRWVVETFQSVSWPAPGWLRRLLIKYQVRRRTEVFRKREMTLLSLTAFAMFQKELPPPTDPPAWLEVDPSKLLKKSRKMRKRAMKVLAGTQPPDPSAGTIEQLTTVLRELCVLSSQAERVDNAEVEGEVAEWQSLCQKPEATALIHLLELDAHREWIRTRSQCLNFPNDDRWIAPTAIGNRMAALDDYAEKRYGIDTSTLWTRIWSILSAGDRAEVSNGRTSVEVSLNLCVGFAVVALITSGSMLYSAAQHVCMIGAARYLAAIKSGIIGADWRGLCFTTGALVGARFAYRSGVYSMGALAEAVTRLVDLYRLKLIVALGFKCPERVGEERELMEELRLFFSQATPLDPARSLKAPPSGKADTENEKEKKSE